MGIIFWIILGGVAGFLASMFMKSSHGVVVDVILGIVGAFVGGMIMNFFGQAGVTGFNLYSLLVAFIGAAVLLGLARVF